MIALAKKDFVAAPLRRRHFWIFQIGFWLISSVSLWFMLVSFRPEVAIGAVVLGRVATGFLLSWLLDYLYRRPFMRAVRGWRRCLGALGLTLGVCLLGTLFWMPLIYGARFPELETSATLLSLTVARFFSLFIWNAMYFGLAFLESTHAAGLEASQARAESRRSELKQLQAQLNPHFLFNALNTIKASLIDPAAAGEATQNLADFLRFSLQEPRAAEPLSREMEGLEPYIRLQRARFGDDLDCSFEASPAALRAMVLPMLVQPLLENAFKFGPQTSALPLRLAVRAAIEGGWLWVRVANSGGWVIPEPTAPPGTGLDNLRRRLELEMGPEASLTIHRGPASVEVVLRLPCEGSAAKAERAAVSENGGPP